jgi:Cu-Zn family superoxide dismutase
MFRVVSFVFVVLIACVVSACQPVLPSEQVTVSINLISATGVGPSSGRIEAEDTPYGLLLTPALSGLTAGVHGFHVHETPSCEPAEKDGKPVAGLAAGGHYDPAQTNVHKGPYADGHLGDLPPLIVAADGTASLPVLPPRLRVSDLKSRSLVIHAGGVNYSDQPQPLGGGGARVACGVVP